jgi:hypothetical protein
LPAVTPEVAKATLLALTVIPAPAPTAKVISLSLLWFKVKLPPVVKPSPAVIVIFLLLISLVTAKVPVLLGIVKLELRVFA